jgi:hypothetical protein
MLLEFATGILKVDGLLGHSIYGVYGGAVLNFCSLHRHDNVTGQAVLKVTVLLSELPRHQADPALVAGKEKSAQLQPGDRTTHQDCRTFNLCRGT